MPTSISTAFEVNRELMQGAAALLEGALPAPVDGVPRHAVMLASIASAACQRLSVVASLVTLRTVGEAAVLARTLIDSVVTSEYITCGKDGRERDERTDRFRSHGDVQYHKMAEATVRMLAEVGKAPSDPTVLPAFIVEARAARDAALARHADLEKTFTRGWTGLGVRRVVRAIVQANAKAFSGQLLEEYEHLSAYVHANALNVATSIAPDEHSHRERVAATAAFAGCMATAGCCQAVVGLAGKKIPPMDALFVRAQKKLRWS